MKDLIIPSHLIKKELKILLACFVVAFLLNIYAIISYGTSWFEIFTMFYVVIIVTGFLYGLTIVVRLIVYGIQQVIKWINEKTGESIE